LQNEPRNIYTHVIFEGLTLSFFFKKPRGSGENKVSNGLQNEPRQIYTLVIVEGLTLRFCFKKPRGSGGKKNKRFAERAEADLHPRNF
jgi:hypothetical protein